MNKNRTAKRRAAQARSQVHDDDTRRDAGAGDRDHVQSAGHEMLADVARSSKETLDQLDTAYRSFLSSTTNGSRPMGPHVARAQIELIDLMNRRARAYLELGPHLAACQTPQDVWVEQMSFLKDLMADWQTTTLRMVDAAIDGSRTRR